MGKKKTPAPKRAGTSTMTTNDRAARELVALEQLEELRLEAPEIYTEMINLLADMVVRCEFQGRANRTKF